MDPRDIIIDTRAKRIARRTKMDGAERLAVWSFFAGAMFALVMKGLVEGLLS